MSALDPQAAPKLSLFLCAVVFPHRTELSGVTVNPRSSTNVNVSYPKFYVELKSWRLTWWLCLRAAGPPGSDTPTACTDRWCSSEMRWGWWSWTDPAELTAEGWTTQKTKLFKNHFGSVFSPSFKKCLFEKTENSPCNSSSHCWNVKSTFVLWKYWKRQIKDGVYSYVQQQQQQKTTLANGL